ncbi:MAG TPA: carotenoid oxygenase family protein [Solimonas sp.]|nr:carotenoid oxygenase family protein [Solimonas sp.]
MNSSRAASTPPEGVNAFNPYLQAYYAPVSEEQTILRCEVIGELPRDLWGGYVRNGPNPVRAPQDLHHWFDGDGMLHGVWFEDGRAEYRNRYVRSADFNADLEAGCGAGGVMLPAQHWRGDKVYKDTANTDVLLHGGSLLALWYISGTPVRLDARTLETLREESFEGHLPRHVSAHSKVDPASGEFVFFDYALYEPWMSFGVVDRDNRLLNFDKIELPGPRLPHDMGLTENHLILHDLPVVMSEQGLKRGQWSIEQRRDQPARFGVVPRRGPGSAVRWFETDPCYIYHVINAWEEGDEVVMQACKMLPNGITPDRRYGPYAPMVTVLALHAVPCEWRMNLRTGAVKQRQLDDRIGEFPVVNLDFCGRRTRYSYVMAIDTQTDLQRFEGIFKYDNLGGACQEYRYKAGWFGSEAAFAPRVAAVDEDDGYLTVFVTEAATGRSEVQVLDARDITRGPLARVQLPCRVPAGFHATWARGDQVRST